MAWRSCSVRLANKVSVILLLSGESPPGSSSALELSMLGLVSVMSSLLASDGEGGTGLIRLLGNGESYTDYTK